MKNQLTKITFGILLSIVCLLQVKPVTAQEWVLVWSDEFDTDGRPNPEFWSFEEGFARNHENQWYQDGNAYCKDGLLVIEARLEKGENPLYKEGATDWRGSREFIEMTSSSINTAGKKEFKYGRFEVCARIPTASGAWPAIWTLARRWSGLRMGKLILWSIIR